ncbi:MAG: T9SS type A sorting domain-containing protein [Chitinophagales bacterium]|nr:T9SS type A sorting domain-containing protein [Chitinophagales bacterium]MDW8418715.1 T9SS type A sorting domain-containing protein [Chitinophagales bacterium]
MKKTLKYMKLLLFLCAITMCVPGSAQICEIDTNNFQMITPDADELPCVERGKPYNTVMQFFCPPQVGGITIDSVEVTSFQNLPNGILYTCNPPVCKMYPWDRACLAIHGVTNDTVGVYAIKYYGYVYTSSGTASFSYLQNQGLLPNYYLRVVEPGDTTCPELNTVALPRATAENPLVVYPNPAEDYFHVYLTGSFPAQINLYDPIGNLVKNITTQAENNAVRVEVDSLPCGVYVLCIKIQDTLRTKTVFVQH